MVFLYMYMYLLVFNTTRRKRHDIVYLRIGSFNLKNIRLPISNQLRNLINLRELQIL